MEYVSNCFRGTYLDAAIVSNIAAEFATFLFPPLYPLPPLHKWIKFSSIKNFPHFAVLRGPNPMKSISLYLRN